MILFTSRLPSLTTRKSRTSRYEMPTNGFTDGLRSTGTLSTESTRKALRVCCGGERYPWISLEKNISWTFGSKMFESEGVSCFKCVWLCLTDKMPSFNLMSIPPLCERMRPPWESAIFASNIRRNPFKLPWHLSASFGVPSASGLVCTLRRQGRSSVAGNDWQPRQFDKLIRIVVLWCFIWVNFELRRYSLLFNDVQLLQSQDFTLSKAHWPNGCFLK